MCACMASHHPPSGAPFFSPLHVDQHNYVVPSGCRLVASISMQCVAPGQCPAAACPLRGDTRAPKRQVRAAHKLHPSNTRAVPHNSGQQTRKARHTRGARPPTRPSNTETQRDPTELGGRPFRTSGARARAARMTGTSRGAAGRGRPVELLIKQARALGIRHSRCVRGRGQACLLLGQEASRVSFARGHLRDTCTPGGPWFFFAGPLPRWWTTASRR